MRISREPSQDFPSRNFVTVWPGSKSDREVLLGPRCHAASQTEYKLKAASWKDGPHLAWPRAPDINKTFINHWNLIPQVGKTPKWHKLLTSILSSVRFYRCHLNNPSSDKRVFSPPSPLLRLQRPPSLLTNSLHLFPFVRARTGASAFCKML